MSTVSSLSLRHLQVDAAALVAVVQLQGPPEGPAGLLLSPVAEAGKPHQIVAVDLISYIVRGCCPCKAAALRLSRGPDGSLSFLFSLLFFPVLPAGLHVGQDVGPGHLRLQQMGGSHHQSALGPGDVQVAPHIFLHLLRRPKGHDRLGADGAVEGDLIPVLLVNVLKLHALRLDGIEHIDARVNEILDKWLNVAAGVV